MAVIQLEQVLMVACSAREHAWLQGFFQKLDDVFHISYDTFHDEITDFAMQDEPYFAHELVENIFHYFGGISAPESIIFF